MTQDSEAAARRYEELDQAYGRAGDGVVLGLFILAMLWRHEGIGLILAGTMPLGSHVARRCFVRDRAGLFRWAKASAAVSAASLVSASLATGGLWSPVLVFSLLISIIAITAFPDERAWNWLAPGVYAVVALATPWVERPDSSSWFGPVCIAVIALAAPRFVSDFVTVEMRQRERAAIDPLTGCLNRAALAARCADIEERAARGEVRGGVAMIDIDRFKQVNDVHGHAVGDDVLVGVARAIEAASPRNASVFRVGGEEFVVLVPDGEPDVVRGVGMDICDAIRDEEFAVAGITVSVGVASADAGGRVDAIVARADAALLRAKRDGRDRVEEASLA